MPPPERRLRLAHAVALGLLQGPTELLPISSSAHTALVPWLAGWSYGELEPGLRKSFEVALHAGAAGALALAMRDELLDSAREVSARRAASIALALAPPAFAGYAFERPIERRLGGPRAIAAGLLAGALAMSLADAHPGPRCVHRPAHARGERREADFGPLDGLALGLAQVAALAPGVSRNGATLAAARARGFARADAQALSWHAGLPVIAGASALKAWRAASPSGPGASGDGAAHERPPARRPEHAALAAGAASAFVSTLASARLTRRAGARARPLGRYALYRCALAITVLVRLRRAQNGGR